MKEDFPRFVTPAAKFERNLEERDLGPKGGICEILFFLFFYISLRT